MLTERSIGRTRPKVVPAAVAISGRFLVTILTATSLLLAVAPHVQAEAGRWALVIGNNDYRSMEPLRNAVADARLIGHELERAGFKVTRLENGTRRQMLQAVHEVARNAEAGGEVVLYFAGHGVQVSNSNYLLPVDAESENSSLIAYESVSLWDMTMILQEAKPRFTLFIIDACRNNPFTEKRGRSLGARQGLSAAQPASGQMIVYSAGSGQIALDAGVPGGATGNGLFAAEMAAAMRQPGVDIREMVISLRDSVERKARMLNHRQRPAIYDESSGRFSFHPGRPTVATESTSRLETAPQEWQVATRSSPDPIVGRDSGEGDMRLKSRPHLTTDQVEGERWKMADNSNTIGALNQYLAEFPEGRYAALARAKIAMLRDPERLAGPSTKAQDDQVRPARQTDTDTGGILLSRASISGKRYSGESDRYTLTIDTTKRDRLDVVRFSRRSREGSLELTCGIAGSELSIGDGLEVAGRCHSSGDGEGVVVIVSGTFPDIEIRRPGTLDRATLRLEELSR